MKTKTIKKRKPKKKNLLPVVYRKRNQFYTTSLDVAEKFGKRHDNVIQKIENLECSEEFKLLNFKELSQTVRGGTQKYYEMTESGFSMLVMGFTGEKAVQWKELYIKAFNQMRQYILKLARQKQAQGQLDWLEARQSGKEIQLQKTDVIQSFVEYAEKQGSKHARTYYMNIQKMEYDAIIDGGDKPGYKYLRFLQKSLPNVQSLKDLLNIKQLMHVATADTIVEESLVDGMQEGMFYKDIYKLAKENVEGFAKCIKKYPALEYSGGNQDDCDTKIAAKYTGFVCRSGVGQASPDRF